MNQLLGGSVCLSPLFSKYIERFARQYRYSTRVSLTLRFSDLVHHMLGPKKTKKNTFHIHIHIHIRMRSQKSICKKYLFLYVHLIMNRHGHQNIGHVIVVGANKPQHMHMCSLTACN